MKKILIISGIAVVVVFVLFLLYYEFFTSEASVVFKNNSPSPVTLLKSFTGESDTIVQEILPGNEIIVGSWEISGTAKENSGLFSVKGEVDFLKVIMPDNTIKDLLLTEPVSDTTGRANCYIYQVY